MSSSKVWLHRFYWTVRDPQFPRYSSTVETDPTLLARFACAVDTCCAALAAFLFIYMYLGWVTPQRARKNARFRFLKNSLFAANVIIVDMVRRRNSVA